MYNRVIFYLKDKKDAAVRVFDADRDIKEKLSIISRNRAEKLFLKMIN